MGHLLYAIYISPLFDLTPLTNFADDSFIIQWSSTIPELIDNLQRDLEMIMKWLKDSGVVVNKSKTELCLSHCRDTEPITIVLNNNMITSKPTINVLGVLFDSNLQWSNQVA